MLLAIYAKDYLLLQIPNTKKNCAIEVLNLEITKWNLENSQIIAKLKL